MKTKFTIGTLLVLFVAFSSCEKQRFDSAQKIDDQIQKNPVLRINKDIVSVENGMLSFKSHNSFLEKMAEWSKMDLEELDKQILTYNFQSYALDTLSDHDELVTPDPFLRRVINENGAIQVGDSIFVLTKGAEIIIKGANIETYKKVISGKATGQDVQVVKVGGFVSESTIGITSEETTSSNDNLLTPFTLAPGTWYGETNIYTPEEINEGRRERMIITVYAQTGALYPTYGAIARGQAYRRGGVFGSKKWRADEIYMLTFTLTSLVNNDGEVILNQPPATGYSQEEFVLISHPKGINPVTGEHIGFKQLNFSLELKKKILSTSPIRTMTYKIIDGVEQPLIDNW